MYNGKNLFFTSPCKIGENTMENEKLFYIRLSDLIKNSGKSFNQIERELGYSRNSLHNYKYSKRPSGARLVELANYFKVSPEYLIGRTDVPVNTPVELIFQSFDSKEKEEMYSLCQEWLLINHLDV